MKQKQAAWISALGVGLAAGAYGALRMRKSKEMEIERLASILFWEPGRNVADVGAGKGRMAFAAALRVGPAGRVFATDLEIERVRAMRRKALKRGIENMLFFQSGPRDSGLPLECCDAVLLHASYHHFEDPAAMNASLYRALRPGGILAVVDFPPKAWLSAVAPTRAPANHGGHGIPPHLLKEEVAQAGFQLEKEIPDWSWPDTYCTVFRKPMS